MKALTAKQVKNLNRLVNINNEYISTSVASYAKRKYSMIVEVLVHTKEKSESLFITLTESHKVVAVNGNHGHSFNQLKGNVTI